MNHISPQKIKKDYKKVHSTFNYLYQCLALNFLKQIKSKAKFHKAPYTMGHYTCICGMMGQIYILMSRSYSISHKCIIESFISFLICIASYIFQQLSLTVVISQFCLQTLLKSIAHVSGSLRVSFKQSKFPRRHIQTEFG